MAKNIDINKLKQPENQRFLTQVGVWEIVNKGSLTEDEEKIVNAAVTEVGAWEVLEGGDEPEEHPNTPEQQEVADEALDTFRGGTKTYEVPEGETINNITLKNIDNTNSLTIKGAVADGAHIVVESNNSLTLENTSDEPVSVHIETKSGKSLTLKGAYNDIYINGKGFSGTTATAINGTVTIEAKDGTAMICGGDWKGQECEIYTETTGTLNITNFNPEGDEKITVYAPNATVTMNNTFDEVVATVSDNTLILNPSFHARKVQVLKGNVLLKGFDASDFYDEIECAGKVEYATTEITASKLTGLTSIFSGKATVMEDIELTNKNLVPGVVANDREELDLNGHTVQMGRSDTGCMALRGSVHMDIKDSVGGGKLVNNASSYGVWANAENVVINIRSGRFEAYTHTMYAYNGTINIYGGEFALLNADTADRDPNGLLKFLLNCYDANYTAGTAHINVMGGKFYEFNPAVSYSEPGGPVSFVAEGYGVVESEEDGKRVFTVLPVDQIPAAEPETTEPEVEA